MIAKRKILPRNFHRPQDPEYLDSLVGLKTNRFTGKHKVHGFIGMDEGTEKSVSMHTNDYLSIANDPRISQVKANFLLENGHGDAISRVFTHDREDTCSVFEREMAKLTKSEDAVTVMSGYNANTGLIQTFAEVGTPVYIDVHAHASLWEGILCARAKAIPFRHNDPEDLRKKAKRYGPGLVAVDALYSTTGTIAPLEELISVTEEFGCAIVVDETHSFGCQGPKGAGLVVALGLEDRVHFRTIGLSKAVAARGGVICGSYRNLEYLRYEARPLIFSTSVLGYEAAGYLKVLEIMASEPWRRSKLHRNHRTLTTGLDKLGYDVSASDSQIIGITIGPNEKADVFKRYLARHGIIGAPFAPPATAEGKSLIRFTVNAALNQNDIDKTLAVCKSALDDLDTTGWICLN